MSLTTGQKTTWYSWDDIPMPDTGIDQVNTIGKDKLGNITFKGRRGRPIGDVYVTGVDGDHTETLHQIETVDQQYAADEQLAAQPPD